MKVEASKMAMDTSKALLLGELSYIIAYHDMDSAIVYAERGIKLSKELNYPKGEIYASVSMASILRRTGDFNKSKALILQIIDQIEQEPNKYYGHYAHGNLGNILHNEGDFSGAVKHLQKAVEIGKMHKDTANLINSYNTLGSYYAEMGDMPSAIKYTLEAVNYAELINDNWRLASGLIRLGEIESDSTLKEKYLTRALQLSQKESSPWLSAFANYAYGNYLTNVMYDHSSAIDHYRTSLALGEQINDAFFMSYVPNLLSNAFLQNLQIDSAEYYGRQSVSIAHQAGNIHVLESGLKNLGHILLNNDKAGEAYDTLEQAYFLKDSIFSLDNSSQMADANAKYETEKKDAELARQELEISKKENQQKNLIGGSLLLLLLSGGLFLYFNERQKRKQKEAQLALVEKEKEAEKLKELDEMKTQFFTNVSHELRTPITLILGPLRDAMEKVENHSIKKSIHLAHSNADRLLEMVNEVLDLSKLESGHIALNKKVVPAKSFFNRVVYAFESMAEIRNIELVVDENLDSKQIMTDGDKLEKILNNLISNAIKYSPNSSKINCKASIDHNQLTISIEDHGRGIHPEEMDKIFNRFYQSNVVTAIEGGGTGVGLALSRELAGLFGGDLQVHSTLGEGSVFTLKIPVELVESDEISTDTNELEGSTSQAIYTPILINGEKPHLLLIEDNGDMRTYLGSILEDEYRCSFAPDGYEALKMIQVGNYDLISSDIMMPNMDGLQLKEKVNELQVSKRTPFIFLSARSLEEDKLAGLRLGVDDYITKPFNKYEYRARIHNLLSNKIEREHWQNEGDHQENHLSIEEEILRSAEQSIKDHINDSSYKVSDLARDLNYSQRQITRIIKQLTGMTPVNFILELRLQRAYHLLKSKAKHTVSEVMYDVGIESASYFARKFKERYGIRPGEV